MEITRIKWDESILVRSFARFNEVGPKASKQVEPTTETMTEPTAKTMVEGSDDWKDFANDIDWAMM